MQIHSLAGALLAVICAPLAAQHILTVGRDDDQLRSVDPLTATTLSSVTITELGGRTVIGANGLAVDPLGGTIWTILKLQGVGRGLATLDPVTGVATTIGILTDSFAGIGFDVVSQTLYGVTGDGAIIPESLYRIDRTTAQTTFVMALGNGTDGETITVAPFLGTMFHASGFSGTRNADRIFETVDVASQTTSQITMFGHDEDEVLALAHWAGDVLIAADLNDDLIVMQANGGVSLLGPLDHTVKGIVFPAPVSGTPYYAPYGSTCYDANGYAPLFAGQTAPAPGNTIQLAVTDAPAATPGVILIGVGTGSVSLGNCALQVLPTLPASFTIAIGGTAPGTGSGSVTLAVPNPLPPLDLYMQFATLSGGAILMSNPLHVHVN